MAHDDDYGPVERPEPDGEPIPEDWQMATIGDVRKIIRAVQAGFDGMMENVGSIQTNNASSLAAMAEVMNSHADVMPAMRNMIVDMGLQVHALNERLNALERSMRR